LILLPPGLPESCRPQAADEHSELKLTVKYDAKVGREQQHFQTKKNGL
jgi:hypothetical protein